MNNMLLTLTDTSFPLSIIEHRKLKPGSLFETHLHEHYLQIFYFIHGKAKMYYHKTACEISSPDILLINKNELHYGENNSKDLLYFVFRIDLRMLLSYNISPCTEKYLLPLEKNLVLFQNCIKSDYIKTLLEQIILEYRERLEGYELKIISDIFSLLAELYLHYRGKTYSYQNAEILMKKTKRFANVFNYIEKNYSQVISLADAAKQAHMSKGYFCRMFKQCTGRSLTDYVNRLRIEKSVFLLNQGICNVTEAAMSVGFDDINYFSRVFKKYMKQSPNSYLKNDKPYFL
ncbi:AraC family transcriptional regulator [Anaerosacchariphilus polymeriproducens]|uniref:AraC family transcriptional regulator n=1 Tax=Anaerosacchariphilus polymeriproducens TaxID=1812858 RepID=A0A371AYG5_9FIRM|nr:AraC family transcriptional regulator [Anaerosacchariphilus polymeriproducens]RDU24607.1 AraC family transcriptional regulator [Anaerosacchariphilus polymeriproducens]